MSNRAKRDSIREEFRRGGYSKVARHLPPNVVELIRLGPDVGAGTGNLILPSRGIELCAAV